MDVATDVEFKGNVDRYLSMVRYGNGVVVTDEDGNKIGKFIPENKVNPKRKKLNRAEVDAIIKSITGVIKSNYNLKEEKDKYLRKKYAVAD